MGKHLEIGSLSKNIDHHSGGSAIDVTELFSSHSKLKIEDTNKHLRASADPDKDEAIGNQVFVGVAGAVGSLIVGCCLCECLCGGCAGAARSARAAGAGGGIELAADQALHVAPGVAHGAAPAGDFGQPFAQGAAQAQAHGYGFGPLRAFAGGRVPGEILPRAGG